MSSEKRGKILAINQVPGSLFSELAVAFANNLIETHLLAGSFSMEGQFVGVDWIKATDLRKYPAWKRITTWLSFTWKAFWTMRKHRNCFALITTNPPLVPWVAPLAKRVFGVKYGILVYDVYPDVMTRMGMIKKGGLIEKILTWFDRNSLMKSDCVITIGECMKRTVSEHISDTNKPVHVIPNWSDPEVIKPVNRADNPFAAKYDFGDKFVVMYSGSFGATHNIEGIIEAAEKLKDIEEILFVLIGKGTRATEIENLVQEKKLPNLIMPGWQSQEMAKYSLAAPDCHIVSLGEDFAGISVPSKTYGALCAGTAVIARCPGNTELSEVVQGNNCGVWVEPNDSDALVAAIKQLFEDKERTREYKKNSRKAVEEIYNPKKCTDMYMNVLKEFL